jgi:hypothetical protein
MGGPAFMDTMLVLASDVLISVRTAVCPLLNRDCFMRPFL